VVNKLICSDAVICFEPQRRSFPIRRSKAFLSDQALKGVPFRSDAQRRSYPIRRSKAFLSDQTLKGVPFRSDALPPLKDTVTDVHGANVERKLAKKIHTELRGFPTAAVMRREPDAHWPEVCANELTISGTGKVVISKHNPTGLRFSRR
jgi:hypothetical protein